MCQKKSQEISRMYVKGIVVFTISCHLAKILGWTECDCNSEDILLISTQKYKIYKQLNTCRTLNEIPGWSDFDTKSTHFPIYYLGNCFNLKNCAVTHSFAKTSFKGKCVCVSFFFIGKIDFKKYQLF